MLLSLESCRALLDKRPSIVDPLAQVGADDVDFEPVRANAPLFRPMDLS